MNIVKLVVAVCALALASSGALGTEQIPPGGKPVIAADAFTGGSAKFYGKEYGTSQTITVSGMPFAKGVRIQTTRQPVKYYNIGLKAMELQNIQRGDTLLLTFYARTTAGGDRDTTTGQINVTISAGGELVSKYIVSPGFEWTQFLIPMAAERDGEPGRTNIGMNTGGMEQTIEFGGVQLLNYGTSLKTEQLPMTRISYAGRESDAAWRKAAEQRIEEIRKADLTISVKDAAGQPVANAAVQVRMKKHAFLWGATINRNATYDTDDARVLQGVHRKLFNMGVCEGEFVWTEWIQPKVRDEGKKLMQFMHDNGDYIRVHVLVWERDNHLPQEMLDALAANDKAKVRKITIDHIREVMRPFKDIVDEWVVENEAVDNEQIRKVLGEESIAEWFTIAREEDPTAVLTLNENHLEGGKPDKLDRDLHLADVIVRNGGPLDTLGIQGHAGTTPIPPEALLQRYDKLAATGKRLAITEYDMATTDEQLKADYTRDVMTAVFSHPAFYNFTIWKWYSNSAQRPQPVILNADRTTKASGKVYEDLVFRKWWTNAQGTTDAAGKFTTRGFLGDYEIVVTQGGKTQTLPAKLQPNAQNIVEITMK